MVSSAIFNCPSQGLCMSFTKAFTAFFNQKGKCMIGSIYGEKIMVISPLLK
jgi:hypothetical protein